MRLSVSYRVFSQTVLFAVLLLMNVANAEVGAPQSDKPAASTADEPQLDVIDESGVKHVVKRDAFLRLPRQNLKVKSHDADVEFEGVSLVALLESVGVKFGSRLRGKRASTVAILEATDGYRVALSLLEIDPETTDRVAVIADQRADQSLDAHLGPYRLVIPGDKREVRWIRKLRTIRVVNLVDYPLESATGSAADATREK